jgi:histidinol-phosphate/aromatic aminotransferase/cobyric acid decarboxylase-like protein
VDAFIRFVRRRGARAAAISNPNNPTAGLIGRKDVLRLCDALADLDLVVVDESFIDFADEKTVPSIAAEAALRENVVVLKSLGKSFGLHGLRAGYAVASPPLASRMRSALPHWNVNGVAEFFIRALGRHWGDYEAGRRRTVAERVAFEHRLRQVPGLRVFPSMANFVYVRLPRGVDGVAVRNRVLCQHGCLIRECGNKVGSDRGYLRLAVRPADEARRLVSALRETVEVVRCSDGSVAVA